MAEHLGRLKDLPGEYRAAGLVLTRGSETGARRYPMMHDPRAHTRATELDHINPETGAGVLPTPGVTAMRIGAGQADTPPLRSSLAGFHVIAGPGTARINGTDAARTASARRFLPRSASRQRRRVTSCAFTTARCKTRLDTTRNVQNDQLPV